MTVVWIVVAIMVLCLAVVFFGAALKYMLQWVVTIALVVVTPIKETSRLYRSKQKGKAILMTVLLSWIFVVFPTFLLLVYFATK